ncbi:histidine kinase [Fibrella sp. HMF5335]|uniref:Histidine kinase n=1 Tax=Fibrella rubiginis TaxID=2817060 RepID=A0A939GCL1_9BACT|nr:sensor histidine kinase [Fibrella rubiginis]MBO0935866.1 histidine kinase [Fibrella rubiginis]
MKSLNYSRYDWLLQLIVLPVYIGLLDWIMIGDAYWHNWTTFGLATGITFAESFGNWLINNQIAIYINRRFTDQKRYVQRALIRFSFTGTSSSINATLLYGVFWAIELPGFELSIVRLGVAVLYTLVVVLVVVMTYESMDTFAYWQQSTREVETLSKAQLQAQLDALRQQVNPHFLFNSLNSLSALIEEDPRQAGAYADELGSVYRYLLRANETPLVTLGAELAFIDSYYHLLKTRHGEALTLVRRILPGLEERQLPPLTLQLLIENAVKHNVLLPEQPLTIDLTTDGGNRLIVSNNVQRKPSRGLSNGVGLSNILSKYQMLGQPAPLIEDDGREFRVVLPLV